MGQAVFQSERNAKLPIEVLRTHVATRKFWLHDFGVMPNHLHLRITVDGQMSIDCFAYLARRKREQGLKPANGVPGSGTAKAMP
jgi:putative transposase